MTMSQRIYSLAYLTSHRCTPQEAIRVAAQPADANHPYGHHKAEYFSAGFEGVLIFFAALAIIWASVHRLFDPQPIEQIGWGLALLIISSALNGWLAWVLFRICAACCSRRRLKPT